jgi:hypothetical protein
MQLVAGLPAELSCWHLAMLPVWAPHCPAVMSVQMVSTSCQQQALQELCSTLNEAHMQDELGRGRAHSAARQTAACIHTAELRRELREWKRRVDTQIESITGEMAVVKNCIMQLYNVLLPGKFPPVQRLPPPAPRPHPHVHARTLPPAPQHPPSYQQVGSTNAHALLLLGTGVRRASSSFYVLSSLLRPLVGRITDGHLHFGGRFSLVPR